MPSPFPGMDPFLEAPEHWHNVHHLLISQIARALNAGLPDGFAAEIAEKVYVVQPEGYYPDVAVTHFATTAATTIAARPTSGNAAPVVTESRPLRIEVESDEIRLASVQVVTVGGADDVVTAIEVLSPINKRGDGRAQYVRKRNRLLRSGTHLLEIDLLRAGTHSVGVPERQLRAQTRWDYLVCLHRAGQSAFDCWPIILRDALPPVAVPLTNDSADFTLDLQIAFDAAYDEGPFRRRVRYSADPTPALDAVDNAWADAQLRNIGLR